MALAAPMDVEAILGRSLTTAETARVDGLLARAEAVVMGYLGCAVDPDPVPAAVTSTVAVLVARMMASSAPVAGAEMIQVDDGMLRFTSNASSGDVWLSNTDKLALRRYRCSGGLTSVQLVGERYDITVTP